MVTINQKNIHQIVDHARSSFHNRPSFSGYSAEEIRLVCLFDALHRWVISQGQEPGFEVEPFIQEDCEPVDGGWNSGTDDTPR